MLEAHYNGQINISEYWHVGDTRVVHIDELEKSVCTSKSHAAQDMTMVIMDFNHDDLTTPINGKSKAAVSIGFRETLGDNGVGESEYYWGKKLVPVRDNHNYSDSLLREWFNEELLYALPATFNSLIKEVNKKNLAYHTKTDEAPLITQDKIWLLSYPEVFGTEIFNHYLSGANPSDWEGVQYEYMKTSNNRIKYNNNNGTAGDNSFYWLRSPSSRNASGVGRFWCSVTNAGGHDCYDGEDIFSLAPAFCL